MRALLRYIKSLWIVADWKGKLALSIILLWIIVAIFDPILATEDGIALIGYDYGSMLGSSCSLKPPFADCGGPTHWLGTDSLGRDVAAGMIHGAKVSLIICVLVVFSALAIGLLIGMFMGYFGNADYKLNIPQYIWGMTVLVFITYYKMDLLWHEISWWSVLMLMTWSAVLFGGIYLLNMLPLRGYGLPLDAIGQRIFEVKESLPNLFLLLAIASIVVKPSIGTLSFTMVLLYWVTFARFARREMMKVKEEDYMIAARAEGLRTSELFIKHALPNIISPMLVVVAFSVSGVIFLESSLSFLGVGLPLDEVTWGKLLAEARKSSSAWWLAVFPGLAIFLLVFAFNTLADLFRDR